MPTKGEQTRERILFKSALVFNRQGIAPTTISDLLQASGTTKGNLYFHFSGKEEVALEVLRRERLNFLRFIEESLKGDSPGQGLLNFFRKANAYHRNQGFVGGCLFGNTALEVSDTTPVFADLTKGVFTEWIDKLEHQISAAQSVGEVRDDLQARDLAVLVVATIEGGIMQARLEKNEAPLARTLETLGSLLELSVHKAPIKKNAHAT